MKNIIKKSMIIAALYYAAGLSACIKDQCNCAPVTNGKFNYTALQATNAIFTIKGDSTFSSNITTADTIISGQYGFRMKLEYKILAALRNPGFFNSAYACDCVTSQFFIVDSVKEISVITLNKLDATHPAGSDVKEYFKAMQQQYSPNAIIYYDDLIAGKYNKPSNPSTTGIDQIDLYLKTPIPSNQEIAFEITFTFASGNKLTAQTKPVFLK